MAIARSTLLVLLALGGCAPAQDAIHEIPVVDIDLLAPEDYAPDRIIVGFPEGASVGVVLDGESLDARRTWPSLRAATFEVPQGRSPLDTIRALRATGRYAWVEPDLVRYATALVDDPYYAYQWHFDAIDLETAWAASTGAGAVVAVIDTGLSSVGSDTPLHVSSSSYDWVDDDSDPTDQNGHGTHVAGTIAQATDNGVGVAGIAYDAELMVLRVLGRTGTGYASDVVSAITYATGHGADILNLSLGSAYPSGAERAACDAAEAAGLVVFAAAGNDGATGIDFPAAYRSVVAVGATDALDERAWYSDTGAALDLMAPGGDTDADTDGDGRVDGVLQETFYRTTWGYYLFAGTSMATPHAAGVAALLVAAGVDPADVRACLEETAVDMGDSGWDTTTGYGLIDAGAALAHCGDATPADADGDGYTTTDDCDDEDASIHPGATEILDDGIDQDCDGLDASSDTTPPVVSGMSHSVPAKNYLQVEFITDESATGEVCTNTGRCTTTDLGTAHDTGSFYTGRFRTYTIAVTDTVGNSASFGPYPR